MVACCIQLRSFVAQVGFHVTRTRMMACIAVDLDYEAIMGRYLIRRRLLSILTLLAFSQIIYSILYLAPGDPLGGLATNPNVSPEVREQIRDSWGLNDPLYIQYFKWAKSYFFEFDWGQSLTSRVPVRDYVFGRLGVTLSIVGTAYLVGVMIAVPVGVISAL